MNHFNKSCARDKTAQRRLANSFYAGLFVTVISGAPLQPAVAQMSVLTYHYDNLRTGWNSSETILTPATVRNSGLALQQTVPLDEQVDAQPLLVPGVAVKGQGTHDVVYVVTENNTVYAIDAASGSILLSQNLGTPVPKSALVGGTCSNNSVVLGIASTPVIDPSSGTLYAITYTEESGAAVYRIHALDITTLADTVPSVVIAASHDLADHSIIYSFQAAVSRQRPALLLSNGTVYAGFGSFCDHNHSVSRGWVLGWHTGIWRRFRTAELSTVIRSRRTHIF